MNRFYSGISAVAVAVVVIIVIVVAAASALYLLPGKSTSTTTSSLSQTQMSTTSSGSNSSVSSLASTSSNSSLSTVSSTGNSGPQGQLLMEFSYPNTPVVASDLSTINYTVKFDGLGNVPASVALNVVAPSGLVASFSPTNLTLANQNTANLQLGVAASTLPGNYQITLTAAGSGDTFRQNETIQVIKYLVVTEGTQFIPRNLTVTSGASITWLRLNGAINQYDSGAHDVVFSSSSVSIVSPTLDQYQTWAYSFNQTGTFSYYCKYHPAMTGEITVVAS